MITTIEKSGKTVEDAINAALTVLNASRDDVDIIILENPSKGFFGFGAKPAKVQVSLKPTQPTVEPAPAVEIRAEPKPNLETEILVEPAETVDDTAETVESESETGTAADFDRTAVINTAKNFLANVFAAMNVNVSISVLDADNEVTLDLAGKNLGVLIGKHGQTLDALQYLTNLAANRSNTDRIYFILDVENYRARRSDSLVKLAKNAADRAVRSKQDVKLEPMSRGDRRIVHTALQDNDKIDTHSAGEDPYRYIIVSPKKRGK